METEAILFEAGPHAFKFHGGTAALCAHPCSAIWQEASRHFDTGELANLVWTITA